jgi:hypothetical protein
MASRRSSEVTNAFASVSSVVSNSSVTYGGSSLSRSTCFSVSPACDEHRETTCLISFGGLTPRAAALAINRCSTVPVVPGGCETIVRAATVGRRRFRTSPWRTVPTYPFGLRPAVDVRKERDS